MFKLNSERPFGGSKALVVDYWLSKEEQKKEEKSREGKRKASRTGQPDRNTHRQCREPRNDRKAVKGQTDNADNKHKGHEPLV